MKKILRFLGMSFIGILMFSCYDDSKLWDSLHDMQGRITALENLCQTMNVNISSLQTIISAVEQGDRVKSVKPIVEDGEEIGYVIEFEKNGNIIIYHGEDGRDGEDGEDGKDGADGYVPVIGVRQDTDGVYYWTLDDEWLTDEDGNKIRAQAVDGKDGEDGEDGKDGEDGEDGDAGLVPVLDIREGYWYVSYDGGSTWEQLGKATVEAEGSGESFFSNVTHDEDYVYFTLTNGVVLTVPKSIPVTEDKNSNNKIFYTTTDGKKIFPAEVHPANYGAILVSSIYEDGQGVLIFDADVTVLGADVFSDCTTLKTIELPSTVAEIGCSTFKGCTSLSSIYFASETPPVARPDEQMNYWNPFEDNAPGRKIYVPQGSVEEYRDAANWSSFASVLVADDGTSDDGSSDDDTSDDGASEEVSTLYYTTNNQMRIYSVNILNDFKDIILDHTYDTDSGTGTIVFKGKIESIPERAFYNSPYLTSVTIPEGVTHIGSGAFDDCSKLESIVLPESLTHIGEYAFCSCKELSGITLPDGLTHIGVYAFSGCQKLSFITIPDSVVSIGDRAFNNTGIVEVHISDLSAWCKIDFGGYYANPVLTDEYAELYLNGEKLTDVVIPDDITEIKSYTFAQCTEISSLTVHDGVTSIGESAFYHCSSLQNLVIPENVLSIGDSAFSGCTGLTDVTVSEGVTSIGDWAFYGCSGITELTIPDSVVNIGEYAFDKCSSLASIHLGKGVRSIGDSAFWHTDLKKVYISDLSAWCKIDFAGITANPLYLGVLFYVDGQLNEHLTIPSDITEIKQYAFAWHTMLLSVIIPDTVTKIGYDAFTMCESLSSITIGKNVTAIDSYFGSDLNEIHINDLSAWCRIDFVGDTAPVTESLYLNGSLIEDLVIPSDITEIKPNVFSGIGSISSITIPDGVTHIGESAFAYSRNVNSINIPSSVVKIASDAFKGCSGIETVDITDLSAWCKIDFENEHSNPIDEALYLNGNEVTSLTLPDDITEVKRYAFNNCAGLVDLTIPENITSVGEFSFAECSIEELTVPSNVEFIGRSAFYCSTLRTVNCLSETPCELGYVVVGGGIYETKVLYGQFRNADIYVPASALPEYKIADGWSTMNLYAAE